jgi:trafficking protein particle complex subunit 9
MDILTFTSPGNVRSLLVPVNEISKSSFESILETLKRVKDVRAVDLSHNPGKFNPQAYPQGYIYLNFITRDDDADSLFLHDFEPYRKTLVLIGIAEWNQNLTDETLRQLKAELKRKYPSPISQHILVFGCPDDYRSEMQDVFTIDVKTTNMETKICDLTSQFLNNFSTYASAYEHTTLRSPGNITGEITKPKKRITSSFDLNPEKVKQFSSKGRKHKLMANFYLLAGNLKSSLSEFCEAVFYLKSSHDYLWLASALDGLATCLFLLSSISVPYQLPQFLVSLLNSVKDVETVLGTPISSPRPSMQLTSRLSNFMNSQDNVSNAALEAVPLDVVETNIFSCGRLALIYFEHTRATNTDYVPQIVVSENLLRYASLMVMINIHTKLDLKLMKEILYSSPPINDDMISPDFDLEYFNKLCYHIINEDFRNLSSTQQMKIFYSLTFLYSKTNMQMKKCLMIKNYIDLVITSAQTTSMIKSDYSNLDQLLRHYSESYGIVMSHDHIKSITNIQRTVLLQILLFCRKISHFEGYAYYASISLTHFRSLLKCDEQVEIYQNLKHYASFANELPRYWDSKIFIDLQFESSENKIVEGEESNVSLLLRNPFAFEVTVQKLQLSVQNSFPVKLLTKDKLPMDDPLTSPTIFLRPYSEIAIQLTLVPEMSGELVVDGIIASVGSCQGQKFVSRKRETIPFQPKLFKQPVQFDRKDDSSRTWIVQVVHKQPLLKIIDIKLEDKWLMLLDGERRRFQVQLKNYSTTEINHLVSMFKDSTTDKLNAELNNKTLQPNEIYEIEYQLYKRKPFRILNKKDLVRINANENFYLDVEIAGKLGVDEASLVLEYSHQKDASLEFSRSLTIPINLTVYPSVELAGCDIISLTSYTRIDDKIPDPCWGYLKKMHEEEHDVSNYCLLALDFVNMWSDEMEITLEFKHSTHTSKNQMKEMPFLTSSSLQSRKNNRMFVPILRMDFDEELLDRRIPSLRNKQFVIDQRTPLEEQEFIKHAFWYKEEILSRLKASWKIPDDSTTSIHRGRVGDIDMRGFRFSSKMIKALEVEKIGVSLKLLDTSGKDVDSTKVLLNTFYTVRASLTNRSNAPIFGIMRHIPVCKDPPYVFEKKIFVNGILQFSIESPLESGEERLFDLGIVFMEKGECEWGVLFDELTGWEEGRTDIKEQHLQREQLKLKVF